MLLNDVFCPIVGNRCAKDHLFFLSFLLWMIIWFLWFQEGVLAWLWQPIKNKILLPWNIWCGKMRHSWFLRQYYDRFCNNNETLSIKSNWLWLLCTGCFKVRNTVLFNLLRSFSKLLFFSSCGWSFINRSASICDDIYFFCNLYLALIDISWVLLLHQIM